MKQGKADTLINSKDKMEAQIHYYFENGLMVFTEAWHLKRGYCCGNGCRHCPYKHEAVGKKTETKGN